jgi:hypothetical protein
VESAREEKGGKGGVQGAFVGTAALRKGLGFAWGEAMDGQRASGTSGSRPEEEEGADMWAKAVSIGRKRRRYPFGSGNDGGPRSNAGLGQIGSPWPFSFF